MSEIEKQFFKIFGIPPLSCKKYLTNCMRYDCKSCENFDNTFSTYPQITDHILLELICILSEWRTYLHSSYTIKANNTLNLKQDVLKDFLELFKWYEFKKCEKSLKHQVQALFKENNLWKHHK